MTRVPCTSCMPSGSVTRRIFFGSPSGSMMTAAMTGWPELDAAVLAGEANLLGAGVLALEAELGPGRVDQLNLLVRQAGRRRERRAAGACCSRCPGGSLRSGLRRSSGAAFGAALGAALGAAGGRCAGSGPARPRRASRGQCRRRQQGDNPPMRPDRRGQDTEIHCGKPFLNGSARNRCRHRHLAVWAAVSLSIEADT